MNNFEVAPNSPQTPEDKLWSMPVDEQISVLKQIFSEEDLKRFSYFQVQEKVPQGNYEQATTQELNNPEIGANVIAYIKENGLLKDHHEEIKKIIEGK